MALGWEDFQNIFKEQEERETEAEKIKREKLELEKEKQKLKREQFEYNKEKTKRKQENEFPKARSFDTFYNMIFLTVSAFSLIASILFLLYIFSKY